MAIEGFKARMGYGGATIEIRLRKDEYRKDEPLHGKVDLMGGKTAQKVRSIHLRLVREWSTERYITDMEIGLGSESRGGQFSFAGGIQHQYEIDGESGIDEVDKIELGEDFKIGPGERRTFPFEIDLSSIQKEKGVREAWLLQARADISCARDACCERRITLVDGKKGRE